MAEGFALRGKKLASEERVVELALQIARGEVIGFHRSEFEPMGREVEEILGLHAQRLEGLEERIEVLEARARSLESRCRELELGWCRRLWKRWSRWRQG